MTAVAEPEETEEGQTQEPVSIEGDVPKPAFEIKPEEDAPAPKKPSKAERRAERGEGYAQEAARLRAETEAQRAENRRFAEQIAFLQGQVNAQRQPTEDPYTGQLKSVRTKMEQIVSRMGRGEAESTDEWHELREAEIQLVASRAAQQVQQQALANQPKPLDPILARVAAKHDWITTDAEARAYAEGQVARLVRQEKRNMNDPKIRAATLLEAAAIAERDLGIGGTAAPTEQQQQRYTGTSGANTGAGTGGRGTVVAMTEMQKGLAHAAFRNLTHEEAEREWWAKIGSKIANR